MLFRTQINPDSATENLFETQKKRPVAKQLQVFGS